MPFEEKDDRNYIVSSPVSYTLSGTPGDLVGKNPVQLCCVVREMARDGLFSVLAILCLP